MTDEEIYDLLPENENKSNMDKNDLVKILDYASKNFEVDNGIGYWLDFEDPQNSYTSEQVVEMYFKEYPLNRSCQCDSDYYCTKEETDQGEIINYCNICKARR